jgi:hypothetical protein
VAHFAFRLNMPVTVVVQQPNRHKLLQLPIGAIFYAGNSRPDQNGMVEGTCKGDAVLIFSRDLQDCAVPIVGERSRPIPFARA